MDTDIIEQIGTLLEIDARQKSRLTDLAMAHTEWDPIMRHGMIHHATLQDRMPERYEDESLHDYRMRLLATRRRLDVQTRLADCLLRSLNSTLGV